MRRDTALTLASLAALAFALTAFAFAAFAPAGVLGGPNGDGNSGLTGDDAADGDPTLVAVGDSAVWPYVAPARSFDRPASSINVVVGRDPASVRRALARGGEWNDSNEERVGEAPDPNESAVVADELVPWRDAPGAPRYTYVAGEGWVAERYQLHRGEYFGSRYHLRVYGVPGGDWTAMQAHAEHWDWFTITHTVDSAETAQRRVEAEFLGDPAFEVRRVHHANGDTYDADGWTTVVLVALAPLAASRRIRNLASRRNRNRVALAGSLATLPLLVRFGGVFFERHLPWLSADATVAVWYPVLVVGVPLAAVALGRRIESAEAGALAGAGFGAGLVLDYAYLGVGVLPVPVAAHRALAVLAVGLVAAGARSEFRWTPALRAGAVLWFAVVVAGHLV